MVGAVIVLFFVAAAMAAPWIAGADPMQTDWKLIRKAPSLAHPFGTDDLGRDTFARVVWGSRISMQAGVFSILLAIAVGVPLGLVAGFYRGAIDQAIMPIRSRRRLLTRWASTSISSSASCFSRRCASSSPIQRKNSSVAKSKTTK